MKIIYILLEVLVFVIGYVSFNSEQHCDCEELSENECNQTPYWCEWSNKTCISHSQDCEHQTSFNGCVGNGAKCQFNNDTCESYECSQFNTSSICSTRSDCFWKNNTCSENFTKCEDYEEDSCPDYSSEYGVILCKKRDGKCLDFNLLNINCSNETLCEEDYTKPDKYHKCQFIEGKCYKVPNKDPCTMFSNSKSLCEYNLDCVYDKSKCRYVECSDLQDQQSCEKYDLTKVDIKILCEWKDDKCQNLTELNLTENNCFDQSEQNYRFYDDKCQQCKKLVPNTPIYNFTNGTDTNGTDTNGTDTNGTDTNGTDTNGTDSNGTNYNLKNAVSWLYNYRCSCNQFSISQCGSFSKYCTWNQTNMICEPYKSSCSSRNTQQSCEFAKCVWKNFKCEKFTKCSDYDEFDCPIHKDCLKKYYGCSDFTSCSDFQYNYCPIQYGCKQIQYSTCVQEDSCTTHSNEDCLNKFEKKNYPCYVDNEGQCKSKFTILKFNICENFHDSEQMCQKLTGCVYKDDKCIKGKCYQFKKDQCFYERNKHNELLCKWDNVENKCGYAELSKLSEQECNYPTLIFYDNQCITCEVFIDEHNTNY